MIKIAFVIDTIESPTAGTEKQLLLLLKHLDRSRFQPYLCVLKMSAWLRDEFSFCPLYDIGFPSFKSPASYCNLIRFSRFLKDEGVQILQTHFVEGNKVGVAAAKLAGVRQVVSTRRNQGYWLNSLELRFLRLLNRWGTCFVANSHNTKDWSAKTEGIPRALIEVIHNGIELDHYRRQTGSDRAAARQRFGIPIDAPVVGIVANLRPVKGVEVFLRAAGIVSESIPDARFVVVGEGGEQSRLENQSVEIGLRERIVFLGRRTDIPEILPIFDVGVLSSHSESFSNSIIEYLAAGLPVVCTDVGGAREAVEDGVNGYVVRPGDYKQMGTHLIDILGSDMADRMGTQSRLMAEQRFSVSAMVGASEQLYERLAGAV